MRPSGERVAAPQKHTHIADTALRLFRPSTGFEQVHGHQDRSRGGGHAGHIFDCFPSQEDLSTAASKPSRTRLPDHVPRAGSGADDPRRVRRLPARGQFPTCWPVERDRRARTTRRDHQCSHQTWSPRGRRLLAASAKSSTSGAAPSRPDRRGHQGQSQEHHLPHRRRCASSASDPSSTTCAGSRSPGLARPHPRRGVHSESNAIAGAPAGVDFRRAAVDHRPECGETPVD